MTRLRRWYWAPYGWYWQNVVAALDHPGGILGWVDDNPLRSFAVLALYPVQRAQFELSRR